MAAVRHPVSAIERVGLARNHGKYVFCWPFSATAAHESACCAVPLRSSLGALVPLSKQSADCVPTYASFVSATKRSRHNRISGLRCSSSTVELCTCFLCARADRTGVHVVPDIVPPDNVRPIEFLVGPCVCLPEPVCVSVSKLHARRQGQMASNVHGGPLVFFHFFCGRNEWKVDDL